MKWLVTGAAGMLGADLVEVLAAEGVQPTAASRRTLDLTDPHAVGAAVAGHEVVVNAAAWTAVDGAEAHEDEASIINAHAPRLLARAAREHGARLVQISTDYVFDGTATEPYAEDAAPSPVSAYGRTKAAGEEAVREEHPDGHLIVRTAWMYGAHGACFPKTVARLARERGHVKVVDDQVGQPSWSRDVADLVVRLVAQAAPAGTYHATSGGCCSWFEFARAVVSSAGLDEHVVTPTTSDAFVRRAPRPSYSVLGHERLLATGIAPIKPWAEAWASAAASVLEHP